MELTPDRELKHLQFAVTYRHFSDGTYSRQGIETISCAVFQKRAMMELTPDRELKLYIIRSICVECTKMELTHDRELKPPCMIYGYNRDSDGTYSRQGIETFKALLSVDDARWNLLPTGN